MNKRKDSMNFDSIPYVVFNTFGIGLLLISKIINNRITNKKFNSLITKINILTMATQQQFDDVITRLDTATNFLANEVRALQDEIKAQGLPQAAEDSIVGKLGDLATRLEAIGTSSANPLPGPVNSTTPVPLGQGTDETTAPAPDGSNPGETIPVSNENTGENTPPSDGAEVDQSDANATMNPNPQPVPTLPGDQTTTLGDDTSIQVGKQPDANNGDTETDPNKDTNPANDETPPPTLGDINMTIPQ